MMNQVNIVPLIFWIIVVVAALWLTENHILEAFDIKRKRKKKMKTIYVSKASPIKDQVIEDTQINITGELLVFKNLDKAKELYKAEAHMIARALIDNLPGATLNHVFAELAEYMAGYLRIKLQL